MANVLVVGLHVYLLQKLIKFIEDQGHFVIGVYSSDMIGKNLRSRQFDHILINTDVSPRLQVAVENAVLKYQDDCKISKAVYDYEDLQQLLAE